MANPRTRCKGSGMTPCGPVGTPGRSIKVPPHILRTAVAIGHKRYPERSWFGICGAVGMEYGVTYITVQTHTRQLRWKVEGVRTKHNLRATQESL